MADIKGVAPKRTEGPAQTKPGKLGAAPNPAPQIRELIQEFRAKFATAETREEVSKMKQEMKEDLKNMPMPPKMKATVMKMLDKAATEQMKRVGDGGEQPAQPQGGGGGNA